MAVKELSLLIVRLDLVYNNNNNRQICIAPHGRNLGSAGVRQRVSEQRKKRKPEKRNVFSLDLKTAKESLLRTVFGCEFRTASAEHQKTRLWAVTSVSLREVEESSQQSTRVLHQIPVVASRLLHLLQLLHQTI